MTAARLFTLIGVAAFAAGAGLWLATRPPAGPGRAEAPSISGSALYGATFRDAEGRPASLGKYQGQWVVLNFWATWCAPCREEMPLFSRLQEQWAGRNVQFVGLSAEKPELAARFARDHAVRYPLWTGGEEVMELSRRLGNASGVLPHTVIIAPGGEVKAEKVGPLGEAEIAAVMGKP